MNEQKSDINQEIPCREKYLELELSAEKKLECKNIIKTINEFGVSQRQKIHLIQLLALELENRDAMLNISQACTLEHSKMSEKAVIEPPKKKILLTD